MESRRWANAICFISAWMPSRGAMSSFNNPMLGIWTFALHQFEMASQ